MFLLEREDLEIMVGFTLLYIDELFRRVCTKILTMAKDFSFFQLMYPYFLEFPECAFQ